MKYSIITVLFIALSFSIKAQHLDKLYKNPTINLVAESHFGDNNNWDKIFETYYDTTWYGKAIGKRKSLIVLEDGTIIVNNMYHNYYSKFAPNGNFIGEFGVTKKDGTQFKKTEPIYGYIGNTLYTGANNMGEVLFFDFNGNYKKSLKLNYSVRQIITLSDTKLAVVGWSIWKDRFRDFVAIVDYNTSKQTIIWEHFTKKNEDKMFNYTYQFNDKNNESNGTKISITTMPFSKYTGMSIPPVINRIKDKLIIAIPSTGEIITFDKYGKRLSTLTIDWAKNSISIEEQKKIQRRALAKYKSIDTLVKGVSNSENKKAKNTLIREMEADLNKINKAIPIPVFSTVIKDSDENLLFFEISRKDNDNKFNVWILSGRGEFKYQSSFKCKDYNLEITPKKLFFYNGYLYSLQTRKGITKNPLRLVKFKLK